MKTRIKSGRPPKYVTTFQKINGKRMKVIIAGMSQKSDGRYYTSHNDPVTNLRKYFGSDLKEAIARFRAWELDAAKRYIKWKREQAA